jgi:hypothetical protein
MPFSRTYDHERAHRTSNLVDRLMKFLDRACLNAQYFHGPLASAELRVRALALLWNLCPSSPATVKKYHGQGCPTERLNGKRHSENGLENLLVSGSMNGLRYHQQNPLLERQLYPANGKRRAYSRLFRARLLLVLDAYRDLLDELCRAMGPPAGWVANDHDALLAA